MSPASPVIPEVPDRDRDRMLATVAHELRTPLMPIISGALVLQRQGVDPELVRATARVIERQGRLLGRLVDDLLDISRAKLGAVQLQRQRVSMSSIVESTIQTVAPYISDRGQFLQVTIDPEPMELYVDAVRLCQALQNILVNAAKFSARGAAIRLHATRNRSDAMVLVSDDGVGIDASHLDSIFTLYAQVENGRAGRDNGLGIGLYLARHFVEAHGGTLTATSRGISFGSTFVMRIPCVGVTPLAESYLDEAPGAGLSPL